MHSTASKIQLKLFEEQSTEPDKCIESGNAAPTTVETKSIFLWLAIFLKVRARHE
jgi:hypothetical protein